MEKPVLDWGLIRERMAEWQERILNPKNHLFADFETYFDKQFSLRKQDMTYVKFITDPRFKVHSVSLATGVEDPYYVRDINVREALMDTVTKDTVFIAQNTQFDGLILTKHYGIIPRHYGDLLGMSRAIFPHERSHGLDRIASLLFPNDPTRRKGDELQAVMGITDLSDELHQVLAPYNNKDTLLLRDSFYKLLHDFNFPQQELMIIDMLTRKYCEPKFVADRELLVKTLNDSLVEQNAKMDAALAYIRKHVNLSKDGINFFDTVDDRDTSRFKTIKSFEQAYRWCFDMGPIRNIDEEKKFLSSNDKFAYILEKGFGIEVPMKPSNGKTKDETYALGKDDVPFQEMMAQHRYHRVMWEGRIASKSNQAATRAASMIEASDALGGLLPIPLKYGAAHTGRFGGGQKLNPQNFGRGSNHRLALTGGEEYVVGVADSSNIEARMSAWFCEFEEKLHMFATGGDPYLVMAESIYNKKGMNKKDHKEERGVGKATELGCGYGMGEKRFRNYLNAGPMGMPPIFLEDIPALAIYPNPYKYVINTYRDVNWPIKDMWRKLENILWDMTFKTTNYKMGCLTIQFEKIILPNGLYLHYPNLKKRQNNWSYETAEGFSNLFGGKVLENIIQALSRIVVTDQMLWTECHISQYGGTVALQVHDEIVTLLKKFGAVRKEDGNWENAEFVELLQSQCNEIMRKPPEWCADIPLDSEGGFDYCYSK